MTSESNNCYVDKLHEVFLSCDSSGCELLGKDELHELCDKLQLDEDQTYYIIDHLLIDPFTKVDFNEFKEVFVSLLTRSQVGYDEIPNLSNPCSPIKHKPCSSPSSSTNCKPSSPSPSPTCSTNSTSTCSSVNSSTLSVPSASSSLSSLAPSISPSPSTSSTATSTCPPTRDDDLNGKSILDHRHSQHRQNDYLNGYNCNGNSNNTNNDNNNNNSSNNNSLTSHHNQLIDDYHHHHHHHHHHHRLNNNNSPSMMDSCTNINNSCSSGATSSPTINPNSAEHLLRSIWDKLRIGQDGYLNINELYAVCEHVGMEISDDVIEQLFEKLDCDRDGKVSFDELLQGLFEHNRSYVVNNCNQQVNGLFKLTSDDPFDQKIDLTGETDSSMSYHHAIQETEYHNLHNTHHNNHQKRKVSLTADHSYIKCQPNESNSRQPSEDDSFGTTGNYFQSLDPLNVGYADCDSIFTLWDSFGFTNAKMLLKDLGFDNKTGRINVRDLSIALEEELFASFTNSSDLFQISLTMFQHELNYTKILYEQTKAERDQLRVNLSEANARADLLAQEVDDHHAKLEKSSKEKLVLLERRYQEQIRSLQDEFQKERDSLGSQASQLRKELSTVQMVSQNNQSKLEDIISSLKLDNLRLEKEVQDLSDRLADAIKVNIDLQKEVEETYSIKKKLSEIELFQVFDKETEYQALINDNELLRRQNKELRDENDGLILEMERMNQKLERRQKKGSKHDAASSMKRMRSYHKNWANEI
ncbi:ninein-like protein [Tetranychus urticae]|nr:ninein-like protein [Tetranychus urticae]